MVAQTEEDIQNQNTQLETKLKEYEVKMQEMEERLKSSVGYTKVEFVWNKDNAFYQILNIEPKENTSYEFLFYYSGDLINQGNKEDIIEKKSLIFSTFTHTDSDNFHIVGYKNDTEIKYDNFLPMGESSKLDYISINLGLNPFDLVDRGFIPMIVVENIKTEEINQYSFSEEPKLFEVYYKEIILT